MATDVTKPVCRNDRECRDQLERISAGLKDAHGLECELLNDNTLRLPHGGEVQIHPAWKQGQVRVHEYLGKDGMGCYCDRSFGFAVIPSAKALPKLLEKIALVYGICAAAYKARGAVLAKVQAYAKKVTPAGYQITLDTHNANVRAISGAIEWEFATGKKNKGIQIDLWVRKDFAPESERDIRAAMKLLAKLKTV